MLDWENEDFVKLYVRDTPGFSALHHVTRALFFELMRKVDLHGNLVCGRLYAKEIAALIRWPVDDTERAITELEADGHVCIDKPNDKIGTTITITNFVNAQNAKQSGKQRIRKHRKLQRADVTHGNDEKQNVTIRLDKSRLDKSRLDMGGAGGNAPDGRSPVADAPPLKRKRKAQSTPIPADWTPNEEHRAKATSLGVNLRDQSEAFQGHHIAKGSMFANWDMAFHNWLRRSKEFGNKSASNEPPSRLKYFDDMGTGVEQ